MAQMCNGSLDVFLTVANKYAVVIYDDRAAQEGVVLVYEVFIVGLGKLHIFQATFFIKCCLPAEKRLIASGEAVHFIQFACCNWLGLYFAERKTFSSGQRVKDFAAGIAGFQVKYFFHFAKLRLLP